MTAVRPNFMHRYTRRTTMVQFAEFDIVKIWLFTTETIVILFSVHSSQHSPIQVPSIVIPGMSGTGRAQERPYSVRTSHRQTAKCRQLRWCLHYPWLRGYAFGSKQPRRRNACLRTGCPLRSRVRVLAGIQDEVKRAVAY